MMHITLLLADSVIIATLGDDALWHGTCHDNFAGKKETIAWTHEQLAAVVALAIGGENGNTAIENLRPLAESGIVGWQSEVRPIP